MAAAPAGSATTPLARAQPVDRREHLLLAHHHDLVHQLANRGDVRRERPPHREAVGDRVGLTRFQRPAAPPRQGVGRRALGDDADDPNGRPQAFRGGCDAADQRGVAHRHVDGARRSAAARRFPRRWSRCRSGCRVGGVVEEERPRARRSRDAASIAADRSTAPLSTSAAPRSRMRAAFTGLGLDRQEDRRADAERSARRTRPPRRGCRCSPRRLREPAAPSRSSTARTARRGP